MSIIFQPQIPPSDDIPLPSPVLAISPIVRDEATTAFQFPVSAFIHHTFKKLGIVSVYCRITYKRMLYKYL